MLERPTPPDEGSTIEIENFLVSRRTCACCKEPEPRYFVRDRSGQVVSMCFGEDGWQRLCHMLGWFPMEGVRPYGWKRETFDADEPNGPRPTLDGEHVAARSSETREAEVLTGSTPAPAQARAGAPGEIVKGQIDLF